MISGGILRALVPPDEPLRRDVDHYPLPTERLPVQSSDQDRLIEPPSGNVSPMETWDAIRARRNVRAYEDRPIPSEHLERILEAAWRTPSSMNEQPWDFVVCTDRETLGQLAETWRYAQHVGGSAATVVLVAPIPTDQDARDWIFYDMGQATINMMLAAADLGIGSSHAVRGIPAAETRLLQIDGLACAACRFVVWGRSYPFRRRSTLAAGTALSNTWTLTRFS
jgi:Nitroreductase family